MKQILGSLHGEKADPNTRIASYRGMKRSGVRGSASFLLFQDDLEFALAARRRNLYKVKSAGK